MVIIFCIAQMPSIHEYLKKKKTIDKGTANLYLKALFVLFIACLFLNKVFMN